MSPAQVASRLDEISAQVDRANDLVEAADMATRALSQPIERAALSELLTAISARLDNVAGQLHDFSEPAQ